MLLPHTHQNWYEETLPTGERKRRGHFSTPSRLVEHILDACGYRADNDLSGRRVLDPACGSGNFLVSAARRLVASTTGQGCAECLPILVQRNLWGFDPDPVACLLAEMGLRAAVEERGGALPADLPLHIHQADGLVFPWEPCVDLLVANPPYLAVKNTNLSGYRLAQRRGQIDSYLLFLNLAFQVVRPGGWMGLVLPDSLLARANAAPERTRLLDEFTCYHLWHLSGVFPAQVGAVVLIAQKSPARNTHQVAWVRQRWVHEEIEGQGKAGESKQFCLEQKVPQSLFSSQPGAELRYLLGESPGALIEQLRRALSGAVPEHGQQSPPLVPLSKYLTISRGEEVGRKHTSLVQRDALVNENDWHPVLRGGIDVRPYGTATTNWYIARDAITKPIERYLAPKLLVVKSTDWLQAALDRQGYVALQTLYLLYLQTRDADPDDLYFYLALLNSTLLRHYVYMLHTAYKLVQPQIEQHVLAHLPVPGAELTKKEAIIHRARRLEQLSAQGWSGEARQLYTEQEQDIAALYHSALALCVTRPVLYRPPGA